MAFPQEVKHDTRGYAMAVLVTLVATAIGWPLHHGLQWPDVNRSPYFTNANVLMLFLLGVLWVATHHSRGAAIVCSICSVAVFDFLFVPPYLTFNVADQQYVLTFFVMLLTALTISTLTNRVREQAEAARKRERRTGALFALSRELAAARTTDEIATSTARHVNDVLGRRTAVLLAGAHQHLAIKAQIAVGAAASDGSATDNAAISNKELGVAQWAFEHDQMAGHGTNTLPAAEGTYLPLARRVGSSGSSDCLAMRRPGRSCPSSANWPKRSHRRRRWPWSAQISRRRPARRGNGSRPSFFATHCCRASPTKCARRSPQSLGRPARSSRPPIKLLPQRAAIFLKRSSPRPNDWSG